MTNVEPKDLTAPTSSPGPPLEGEMLSPMQVMKQLRKKYNITATKLFAANTKNGILRRARFPILGQWMNEVIFKEFQE